MDKLIFTDEEAEQIQKKIKFYEKNPMFLKMELEEAPKKELIRYYKSTTEYKSKLIQRKRKLLKK